jgi:hypothetical protein
MPKDEMWLGNTTMKLRKQNAKAMLGEECLIKLNNPNNTASSFTVANPYRKIPLSSNFFYLSVW